jgi:8-oxo-dGTP pyrophosphatase MutT (NUDIX family)
MVTSEHLVAGIEVAVERYGRPETRHYILDVSANQFDYWSGVAQRRPAEVVLALRRPDGRFLLHTKSFYPQSVYRLLTGGVHPGEDLIAAALREAMEETGHAAQIERFLGILHYRFRLAGREIPFVSYVFLLTLKDGEVQARDLGERITGYREVPLQELSAIADELEALDPDWVEWGRFRAVAHRFLLEVMTSNDE